MKIFALPILAGLALSGCAAVDNVLDKGAAGVLEGGDIAVDRMIEGSNTGAKNYCRLPLSVRERMRQLQAERADTDEGTAGIRIRITCPQDEDTQT